MKKIVFVGKNNRRILEAIISYFQGKNIEIVFLFCEQLAEKEIVDNSNVKYFSENEIFEYIENSEFDLGIILSDFTAKIPQKILQIKKFIKVHSSLLPAFDSEQPVLEAFKSGVKVSGVTIYTLAPQKEECKIIAQYPVLIGLTTHIDEFETELSRVVEKLLPPVIQSVLEDKVFDFHDLFRTSCHGNGGCSQCGKCHK